MMSPSYADTVRKLLRHDRAAAPAHFPADRDRMVAAVARALQLRRRRQRQVRFTMAATAVAAAVALLLGGRGLLDRGPRTLAPQTIASAPAERVAPLRILSTPDVGRATPGMMVGRDAPPVPLEKGMALQRGIRLVAPPAGQVRIGAARGTALTLEGGGDMRISEDGIVQRYELRAGSVRAHVAKLAPGERFIIATADAEVEVHGTAFRVAIVPSDPACGDGTTTRVSVSEGIVSVRSEGVESSVTPGGVWPPGCPTRAPAEEQPASASVSSGGRRADSAPNARGGLRRAALRSASPASGRTPPTVALPSVSPSAGLDQNPAPPTSGGAPAQAPVTPPVAAAPLAAPTLTSDLAAQNDLFASGVRAKRRGRGSEAIRIFERFAREYPDSPLLESAVAQRMKLLGAIDLPAARRAALEYLARYPNGFARSEARSLVELSGT